MVIPAAAGDVALLQRRAVKWSNPCEMDDLASIASLASLAVALVSLVVAVVALRFAIEQTRAYLFPVPMLLLDDESGDVVVRNLGGGPMVDVWLELRLFEPAREPTRLERHLPSVIAGEQRVVAEAELLSRLALAEVTATIRFENLRGVVRRREMTIGASELVA
jgi:hypothetical protein